MTWKGIWQLIYSELPGEGLALQVGLREVLVKQAEEADATEAAAAVAAAVEAAKARAAGAADLLAMLE